MGAKRDTFFAHFLCLVPFSFQLFSFFFSVSSHSFSVSLPGLQGRRSPASRFDVASSIERFSPLSCFNRSNFILLKLVQNILRALNARVTFLVSWKGIVKFSVPAFISFPDRLSVKSNSSDAWGIVSLFLPPLLFYFFRPSISSRTDSRSRLEIRRLIRYIDLVFPPDQSHFPPSNISK